MVEALRAVAESAVTYRVAHAFDAKHPYNLGTMIESAKASLEYFSREFSPHQYRQFRVLEFPRCATFAQSFPNTIPYSEAIGFIADLRDEKDIDYVFYVTAHEMAHPWWAHQVLSSRMQGMTVPVETLAQYSALMVMEKEYGPEMMRRFLRRELDGYLRQRGGEQIEELPLPPVENQGYIHYQKGSIALQQDDRPQPGR
jgi:ABC-2 type transport system permease protein